MSRTDMAGLQLNVDVIDMYLRTLFRRCNVEERLGASAPVYLAAVLEYLLAEVLELSGGGLDLSDIKELKKKGVTTVLIHPLDVVGAVSEDEVLCYALVSDSGLLKHLRDDKEQTAEAIDRILASEKAKILKSVTAEGEQAEDEGKDGEMDKGYKGLTEFRELSADDAVNLLKLDIPKVLAQVHPIHVMSDEGMDVVCELLKIFLLRLDQHLMALHAKRLAASKGSATLTGMEVQSAMRSVFVSQEDPDEDSEIFKHAQAEGKKAVRKLAHSRPLAKEGKKNPNLSSAPVKPVVLMFRALVVVAILALVPAFGPALMAVLKASSLQLGGVEKSFAAPVKEKQGELGLMKSIVGPYLAQHLSLRVSPSTKVSE